MKITEKLLTQVREKIIIIFDVLSKWVLIFGWTLPFNYAL